MMLIQLSPRLTRHLASPKVSTDANDQRLKKRILSWQLNSAGRRHVAATDLGDRHFQPDNPTTVWRFFF